MKKTSVFYKKIVSLIQKALSFFGVLKSPYSMPKVALKLSVSSPDEKIKKCRCSVLMSPYSMPNVAL